MHDYVLLYQRIIHMCTVVEYSIELHADLNPIWT